MASNRELISPSVPPTQQAQRLGLRSNEGVFGNYNIVLGRELGLRVLGRLVSTLLGPHQRW